jgi:hypothetical protein
MELVEAVRAGNIAASKELIASGSDLNQLDKNGWTPLNWAAAKADMAMVMLLVESGADAFKVGKDLRTPAAIALAAGHAEVARFLRQAEDRVGGPKAARPERQYCAAFHLKELQQFPGWVENRIPARPEPAEAAGKPAEDGIVFLHQDYTVTNSIWRNEDVIFDQVTPQWKEFCASVLGFKVPDDFDLIVPVAEELAATGT